MRPIGLMASVRVRDIIHWQECADTALYGYRPGRRAEDVWIDLSLTVEPALVDGSDLMDMSIDCSKCFDRVPQGIDFQLAERQGIHLRVLQPLRGMHRELRRRFVVAGHVGKEFEASNGIIQGSLLKCAFNHLFHQHLGQIRESRVHRCNAKVYVDDAGVLSKESEDIDVGLKITGCFARDTQQKLNVERTKAWSCWTSFLMLSQITRNSAWVVQWCCGRLGREETSQFPGAFVPIDEGQLDWWFGWADRNAWFPCRWLHSQTDQFATDGSCCSSAEHESQKQMPWNFVDALLRRALRGQSLRQLRRMAEHRPEAFVELECVWHCFAKWWRDVWWTSGDDAQHAALDGLALAYTWLFAREGRPHVALLDGPEFWWLHEIRQGLRRAEWKKAGTKGRDMRGLNITKIPPDKKAIIVSFSAVASGKKTDSSIATEQSHRCVCFLEKKMNHMLWRCPRRATFRSEKQVRRLKGGVRPWGSRFFCSFFFGLHCCTISCNISLKIVFFSRLGGNPSMPLFLNFSFDCLLFSVFFFFFKKKKVVLYIVFHFFFFFVDFLFFLAKNRKKKMKRNASKRDERHGRSRHRATKVLDFVKLILRPWRSQQAPMRQDRSLWPPCKSSCGIFFEDPRWNST